MIINAIFASNLKHWSWKFKTFNRFFNLFIFEQSNELQRNFKNWEITRKVFIFVEKHVKRFFTSIRYFLSKSKSNSRKYTTIKRKLKRRKSKEKNCTITMFCLYLFQNCFCFFDIDAFCEVYDSFSFIYRVSKSKSWFCYWHVDFHE